MDVSVCNVDHMIAVHMCMFHLVQVPIGEKSHADKI